MVVNYQNGKIYCIRSHQTNDIYIGSTTQPLSVRMAGHRRKCKHWKEGKGHYVTSFGLLQYDDCYIELIEEYPSNSKMELERREGELIREMDCVNKIVVGRTIQEWKEDNREKLLQGKREDYQRNKERYNKRSKEDYHKNREKYRQLKKEWYEKNKEKIRQQRNKKVTCECGCTYTLSNKRQHERSKKHIKFINQ